ncbi:MAG: hypothetical protein U1E82_03680 [Nitrosomonas sp.]
MLQINNKLRHDFPECLHTLDFLGRISQTCQLWRFLVATIVIVMEYAIRQTGTRKLTLNSLQG